jgi:hypothetical protein
VQRYEEISEPPNILTVISASREFSHHSCHYLGIDTKHGLSNEKEGFVYEPSNVFGKKFGGLAFFP